MTREKVLVAIIGFFLGIAVIWTVWTLYQFLPKTPPSAPTTTSEEIPPISPPPAFFTLTLTSPEDESVVFQNSATISGKTEPFSLVVISGGAEDQVLNANEEGSFSLPLSLSEGPNEIVVTAYGKNGEEIAETRSVTFSKEEF